MSTGPFQLRKGSTVRAVVQRCSKGAVKVKGEVVGEIGIGFVVLLGVGLEDEGEDARYLADKIANLRVFPDEEGKLNVSALDAGADILVVSSLPSLGTVARGGDQASPRLPGRTKRRSFIAFLSIISGNSG